MNSNAGVQCRDAHPPNPRLHESCRRPRRAWLLIALTLVLVGGIAGCGREVISPSNDVENSSNVAPLVYAGGQTLDDVRASLAQIEKLRGEPFTPQEIEEITSGFVAFRSSQALSWQDAQATDHFAYTVHFHSRPWYDPDLWFEYKWNAGGRRQSYRIVVYDWVIYRHLRACYKNGLANWTWLEGRDQRVTLVIGLCGYAPYGPAAGNILRSVVRIVT